MLIGNLGRISTEEADIQLDTIVMKNPGRTVKIGVKIGSATVSWNPKTAISTTLDRKLFIH